MPRMWLASWYGGDGFLHPQPPVFLSCMMSDGLTGPRGRERLRARYSLGGLHAVGRLHVVRGGTGSVSGAAARSG